MAIRFEPKTPETQKPKPSVAAPSAPPADAGNEPAKPIKAKSKTAARGDKSASADGEGG